jgi:hypothetical protein
MREVRAIYEDRDCSEYVTLNVHDGGHVIDLPGPLYFVDTQRRARIELK